MLLHPQPDPVAFAVFGWPVRWYGVMYLFGFVAAWLLGRRAARRAAFRGAPPGVLEDMISVSVLGVIVGGRLGYVLFYKPAHYFDNPAEIPRLWDGGMSFHGGLLGVVLALWLLAKIRRLPFLRLTDYAAVLAPPGLFFGRVGNFINAELPGRAAPEWLPWAMLFPGDPTPRHPSQLYEAALEGLLLGVVLWSLIYRRRAAGFVSGMFLAGYAAARFVGEFFREPDAHLGLLLWGLSMGQWLSLPMLVLGLGLAAAFAGDEKKAWGDRARPVGEAIWGAVLRAGMFPVLAAKKLRGKSGRTGEAPGDFVGDGSGGLVGEVAPAVATEASGETVGGDGMGGMGGMGGRDGRGGVLSAMKSWAFSRPESDDDDDEYDDDRPSRRDKRRLRKKKRRK